MALSPDRRATLERSFNDLFRSAGISSQGVFWCGLRPMTPDGPPIIGATPVKKLFLNTGHGTLGWTMACGSARLLSDIISGRRPEIDPTDLDVRRYAT